MTRNVPLRCLGWIVVATGTLYVLIATLFPSLSGAVLVLSPDHAATDVGTAGMDIILALTAVFGATMIGWGILIVYLADRFSPQARKFLTISVLTWYLADTGGSLCNHLGYNAILNSAFLLLALAALFVPQLDGEATS